MKELTNKDLYDYILSTQIVNKSILDPIYKECEDKSLKLSNILEERDLVDAKNLGKILADLYRLPFIDLNEVVIPKDILNIIPAELAKLHNITAFNKDTEGIHIATNNLDLDEIVDLLSKKTNGRIILHFATLSDIKKSHFGYTEDIKTAFDKLIAENIKELTLNKDSEPPVIKFIDTIINYAYCSLASDIHIEPTHKVTLIRFRIDGVLNDILELTEDLEPLIVNRIKVMANLRTDKHQLPQDGRFTTNIIEGGLDVRVSISPITRGEKVVLRILSEHSRQYSLSSLGLSENDIQIIQDAYTKSHGMIISAGPTGAGKTTTLYAILKLLNTRGVNIMTIEDPVEYNIEDINQLQVNTDIGLTFASGLKSIVRQDPDIILVGEIRDNETADMAINSAMTGHLVLTTLHANDATTALPRLIEMKVEPFLIASSVKIIIGQRLVRKICLKCRVSEDIEVNSLDKSISSMIFNQDRITIYKGKGCPVCNNTGYSGRIGVFEILKLNERLSKAITERKDSTEILELAKEDGFKTMLEDGFEKVKQGLTTTEELLRATRE